MFEQLSKDQYSILKRLANHPVKVYCSPAGIDADRRRDEITTDFNSMLRLVELGLVRDVTDLPKYAGVVSNWREQGRDVVVIHINALGGRMFTRTRHDK